MVDVLNFNYIIVQKKKKTRSQTQDKEKYYSKKKTDKFISTN